MPKKQWIYDYFYEFASEALQIFNFENFLKSMTSCLFELKVTPSFCFAFKIPDNVTATIRYNSEALHIVNFENFLKSMTSCLSELKVTPSFCFPFKIPDDPTATTIYCNRILFITSRYSTNGWLSSAMNDYWIEDAPRKRAL